MIRAAGFDEGDVSRDSEALLQREPDNVYYHYMRGLAHKYMLDWQIRKKKMKKKRRAPRTRAIKVGPYLALKSLRAVVDASPRDRAFGGSRPRR